jgi:hypothetical protein
LAAAAQLVVESCGIRRVSRTRPGCHDGIVLSECTLGAFAAVYHRWILDGSKIPVVLARERADRCVGRGTSRCQGDSLEQCTPPSVCQFFIFILLKIKVIKNQIYN